MDACVGPEGLDLRCRPHGAIRPVVLPHAVHVAVPACAPRDLRRPSSTSEFPLHLLHAAGDLNADYAFMRSSDRLSFEELVTMLERSPCSASRRSASPAASRCCARASNADRAPRDIADRNRQAAGYRAHDQWFLLAAKARSLNDAGLRRMTVSLDAVEDALFRRMNDVDLPVSRILEGIEAARAAGLAPLKVNSVIERGVNDSQILPLVRLSAAPAWSFASSNTWTSAAPTSGRARRCSRPARRATSSNPYSRWSPSPMGAHGHRHQLSPCRRFR